MCRCSLVLLSVDHEVPFSSFFIGWRAEGRARAGRPDMADGSGWQPPRPCESYRAEWKLCRSARHFLHHYYVHGERPACEQWQRDLASCRDWEERRSAEAQVLDVVAHTCNLSYLGC
uniref:Synaptic plasticity regulator PANTS n=2 Tax=Pongo abelii TaxID=9601 RepID=A0A8I5UDT3_PONAB